MIYSHMIGLELGIYGSGMAYFIQKTEIVVMIEEEDDQKRKNTVLKTFNEEDLEEEVEVAQVAEEVVVDHQDHHLFVARLQADTQVLKQVKEQ